MTQKTLIHKYKGWALTDTLEIVHDACPLRLKDYPGLIFIRIKHMNEFGWHRDPRCKQCGKSYTLEVNEHFHRVCKLLHSTGYYDTLKSWL